jgi:carbon storage regulator
MGLVLGRKPGEGIVIIGPNKEEIFVEVVRSEEGSLRLNIDAPRDYNILRSEIFGKMEVAKILNHTEVD